MIKELAAGVDRLRSPGADVANDQLQVAESPDPDASGRSGALGFQAIGPNSRVLMWDSVGDNTRLWRRRRLAAAVWNSGLSTRPKGSEVGLVWLGAPAATPGAVHTA